MVKITKVWTTQLYRNEHIELSDELIIQHFGSVEAFLSGLSNTSDGFNVADWPDDFVEALSGLEGDVVERESEWESAAEYHAGQIVKVDRLIEPYDE